MPSYLVLARKYRPATFSDVVGQEHVVRTLQNSILSGRVAHAFLFCGVRGVGKTTVARILAKALNCSGRAPTEAEPCGRCSSCREIAGGISVDVQEIDGASHTSVENIREINENIKYPPVSSPYKIIIIDEVHMISINAFNALLKTLEEPPAHAKFMFATTESHKVPSTINSRCQRFNLRTISMREIAAGMSRILEQEGIEADAEALDLVAREAQGSFRDALSLLDQVIAFGADRITAEHLVSILGIAGRDCFGRLCGAVLRRDPREAMELVRELFQKGYDPEQFVLDMTRYMRNLLVLRTIPDSPAAADLVDAPASEVEEMTRIASASAPEELLNLLNILVKGEGEIKRSSSPWVAVEMMVMKMAFAPDIRDLSELLSRIDAGTPPEPTRRPDPARKPPEQKSSPKPSEPRVEPSRAGATAIPAEPAAETPDEPESPARFTITAVRPVPTGTPDEVWAELKERVAVGVDQVVKSIMEHGTLISFGPTQVEIGFHKSFYREAFEEKLRTKREVREIFEEFFGDAQLRILTLAKETSLSTENPYAPPEDGQTDFDRALRSEAIENPVTKAILGEFEDSTIEAISILTSKT